MIETTIADLFAWEAFDSRGTPTVACEVVLSGGASASVVVPSGASTGSHEAFVMRDGGGRFDGLGVRTAVGNVNGEIRDAMIGMDAADQDQVDRDLVDLDGDGLRRLGANAALPVSIGCMSAAAVASGQPLFAYASRVQSPSLPMPMVNIISGGAHVGAGIDIQDVLVVPIGSTSFGEAIASCWEIRRHAAAGIAHLDLESRLVADEGGLGPRFDSNVAALDVVTDAIHHAGFRPGVDAAIALDVAATQLRRPDGLYALAVDDRIVGAAELSDTIRGWCSDYPIVSVEDPLAEDEWDTWQALTDQLSEDVQIVGDDLFVTQLGRLERGISAGVANAILVKPNQVGTLSGALEAVGAAHAADYRSIISARSGDTEDSWLADLAVAWGCSQIKVGSTTRSERTSKWNRLLYLEARHPQLGFAGW